MAGRRHRIHSKAVKKGRHIGLDEWEDDRWVHCKRCGHVCNLDRDLRARDGSRLGWGNDYTSTTFTTTGDDMDSVHTDGSTGQETRYNPTRVGGCPFCGSYMYAKK